MSTEDLKFALLLRAARSVFNLSLKEIGAEVDVSAVAVGKWESGDAMIKASTFRALQRFFYGNGVSMTFDQQGDAIIRIRQSAVEQIAVNPKKPPIKSLQAIDEEAFRARGERGDYNDLRNLILDNIEQMISDDPEFLKKSLDQSTREDCNWEQSPLNSLIYSLLSTYRSEKIFDSPRVMKAKSSTTAKTADLSEGEFIDPMDME